MFDPVAEDVAFDEGEEVGRFSDVSGAMQEPHAAANGSLKGSTGTGRRRRQQLPPGPNVVPPSFHGLIRQIDADRWQVGDFTENPPI